MPRLSKQRLGAHMSIQGGLHLAVDRARTVGATALQLFVKSARQWNGRPLLPGEIRLFRERAEESGLARFTMAHAGYLLNLATSDAALRRRSITALRDEVRRCERLNIPYLVLHPGAHTGAGEESGLRNVVRALDRALAPADRRGRAKPAFPTCILLETTAGQGSTLGHRFEHLAVVLDRARCTERLGVCFDTCHALAAGYEFRDRRTYLATFREFDRIVGLDRLRGFHLNDSKHALGSRKDRHEHIGRGTIGLEAFRLILGDRRFRGLPMVLETPKGPDLAQDRENLSVLRQMLPAGRR